MTEAEWNEWAECCHVSFKALRNLRAFVTYGKYVTPPEENVQLNLWIPMYSKVYTKPPEPYFNMADYADDLMSLANSLDTASHEEISKIITGLSPMSAWDDLQIKLEAIGVDEYVELLNKAYKEGR